LSRQEAARRLGVPEGTISSRLARAKNQLRDRLARRGLGIPMVVLSAALVREASAATLSDALIESTAEAAMCVAAGSTASVAVAASVVSLTEGVLKTMLLTKLKATVLSLGTLGVIVSGAVVLGQSGSKPVLPLDATQESRKAYQPTAKKALPISDDETVAVERKLDRILKALDLLVGTIASGGAEVVSDPFTQTDKEQTKITSLPALPEPLHEVRELPPLPPTPVREASISERLQAVEHALSSTQAGLQKLHMRLTRLENHVGVNVEETRPPTPETR
jgi:hypothetical protein